MSNMPRKWIDIRREWPVLSLYQRFEVLVVLVLTFVIGLIAVVALYRLVIGVVDMVVLEALNPLEHSVFQQVFGEIMTLLIAMESITRCITSSPASGASFTPRW